MKTILVSAGDLSGERHAAALVRALRLRRPDLRYVGMGGEAMRAAGVEIAVDRRALAVGGLVELLPEIPRIFGAWRGMLRALEASEPALVVLVDSGGFNLPFAARVRRRTQAPILYFMAPQIWAWRPGRLRKLVARCDRIVVGLPFECDYYAARGVAVEHPGHPLVDALAEARRQEPADDDAASRRLRARRALGLPENAPLLGLFPGSRRSELVRHLPLALDSLLALRALEPRFASLEGVIGLAEGIRAADLERLAGDRFARLGGGFRCVETQDGRIFDALDVALTKPGTVTLEATLRGCPQVVMGRAHPVSVFWLRRSARVEFVALPNLLVGEEIVPELLQEEATPARIAAALAPLFDPAERARQRAGLARAVERLGPPGAIEAVATCVEEMLGSARA